MITYTLSLSEDEALVLFEFFSRFDDTGRLEFRHPAEYIALQHIAGEIDKTTAAMFKTDYQILLEQARSRVADGFEGDDPGMGNDQNHPSSQ
jgi:phage terminase small subunit